MNTILTLGKAKEVQRLYMRAGIPCYTRGAPGIGKTANWRAIAAEEGLPIRTVELGNYDSVDVHGIPMPKAGRSEFTLPDFWPETDEPNILFFDELSNAAPAVQAVAMQIFEERRIGTRALPEKTYVCAAGNNREDRAFAQRLGTALVRRMAVIEVTADVREWSEWAAGENLPSELIGFLNYRNELLQKMPEGDSPFPNPASWHKLARVIDAPESISLPVFAGLVGEGAAIELRAFLKTYRELDPIPEIIANPEKARIPKAEDNGVLFAVSAALARFATVQNFPAIMKYLARLPQEFQVMAVVDASKRKPEVTETAAFVAWANKNADVFK